ncbi:MAG: zinc-ribbon domain containing protein [Patescibacteria group bacterium]|jgi:hypothetical protein
MQCKNCQTIFIITVADQQFYRRINIPDPDECPACREQNRLAFRNERDLYRRQCDLCQRQIVSMYSADKPYKVYCADCFNSDRWDPFSYGREFDFNRPFFPQYAELMKVVPRLYAFTYRSVNSEYTNGAQCNKNCYLLFLSDYCEDCYFSNNIFYSVGCLDLETGHKNEVCYQCVNIYRSYHLAYCSDCEDCVDCVGCVDCKGCHDCFGSAGLRQQEYCFFNQKLSADEYQRQTATYNLGSYSGVEKAKAAFKQTALKHIYRYYHGAKNKDFVGDYLTYCQNSYNCFDGNELLNCKNVIIGNKLKDCHDCYAVVDNSELCYQCISHAEDYNNQFCLSCIVSSNNIYSELLMSGAKDCFGCIGFKRAQYCILNKQYTESEYQKLRAAIVEKMKTTDEWGRMFPIANSPFGYNETVAADYHPLNTAQIKAKGWPWQEHLPGSFGQETIKSAELPDDIKTVKDEITKEVLACQICNRNYKIIPQELKFYRQYNYALPRLCPECRFKERINIKNPKKLYRRQCQRPGCANEFETTYAPERPEKVYCEECYRKEIY